MRASDMFLGDLYEGSFTAGFRNGSLGRPLGYLMFSLVGLKRTLFTNIFQEYKDCMSRVLLGSRLVCFWES